MNMMGSSLSSRRLPAKRVEPVLFIVEKYFI